MLIQRTAEADLLYYSQGDYTAWMFVNYPVPAGCRIASFGYYWWSHSEQGILNSPDPVELPVVVASYPTGATWYFAARMEGDQREADLHLSLQLTLDDSVGRVALTTSDG